MSNLCPACGAILAKPNARFCTKCGQAIAAHAPPATGAPPTPLASSPPPTQRIGLQQQPQLLIQEPGLAPRAVALAAFPVLLGRGSGADTIQLSHPAVSRQHAELTEQGGEFWVTDLGSANGTGLNGRQLPPHSPVRLNDGDILRIGDAQGNSVGVIFRYGGAPSATISKQLGKLQLGQSGAITLGRDPGNDVRLDHPVVSRFHAEVRRTPQGDLLIDRSANGTFVNGQRIRSQHRLQTGDVVQIGPYKLSYDPTALTQATPVGAYRLDAVHLKRQVVVGGARLPLARNWRNQGVKLILNDVNLSIQPREFVALVGGSGAGKSTLMKALSGFTPADGRVLINGDDLYRNFAAYRGILGYVPQDDIIHRQLPVRSALRYAARLRLPDATPAEIEQRVATVLDQVEMTAHKDKVVGMLSGGQRKRVSIAVELLADPGLFFLDEPTSGLDPGLEKKMMHTLRQLADAGRTVVLVTHATANIDQCDLVAFMADGNLAFYGPPQEALKFFAAHDFADIYTKLTRPLDPVQNPPPPQWTPAPAPAGGPAPALPPAAAAWAACYRASAYYRQYVDSRLQQTPQPTTAPTTAPASNSKQKDSPWRQFVVLTERYAELIRRDMLSLVTLLLVMPLIGLLLLVMANRPDLTGLPAWEIETAVQNELATARWEQDDPGSDNDQFQGSYHVVGSAQTLLFMLALAANLLGVFGASYEVVKEGVIYQRERMVNLKLGPYLFSKFVILGLFALVQCALLLWVVGWRVDYPADGVLLPGWLELYVTLVLAALGGITLGLLLSAVVRSENMVIYLILVVLFIQIMFAGAIFRLPDASTPISYLTPTRWALEGLGSTVDMARLNALGVTCVEAENEQLQFFLGEGELPCADGQQKLIPTADFNVDYAHETQHLFGRWAVLAMLAAAFGGLTLVVQKRKDVI